MLQTIRIPLMMCLLLNCAGCWPLSMVFISEERWFRNQVHHGYVLDMEDAGAITEWTLRQHDLGKVDDGVASLFSIIRGVHYWNEKQRRTAATGLIKVFERALASWPDLRVDPAGPIKDVAEARASLPQGIRQDFYHLRRDRPDDPIVQSLWKEALAREPDLEERAYPKAQRRGMFEGRRSQ